MLHSLLKYIYYGTMLQFLSVALVVHYGLNHGKDFRPLSHLVAAFLAIFLHSYHGPCK